MILSIVNLAERDVVHGLVVGNQLRLHLGRRRRWLHCSYRLACLKIHLWKAIQNDLEKFILTLNSSNKTHHDKKWRENIELLSR